MQALDGMPTAKVLWAGFLVTAINPMELILGIAAGVVIGSASIAPAMAAAALLIDPATATTTVAAYLLLGSSLRRPSAPGAGTGPDMDGSSLHHH